MKSYNWMEDAPNYNYHEAFNRYSSWLSEHIGKHTWGGIGYPLKQLFEEERVAWQIIHAAMSELEPGVLRSAGLRTITMYEGEGWRLFVACWQLNVHRLAHKALFWVQAETDAELIQFKLSCL